jgi:CSLREA domain-containing protein
MEGNIMTRSRISILVIALVFLATQSGMVAAAPEAPGASIIVNTTADELDGDPSDDTCSLREALQSAGNNMAVGGCAAGEPGADTINLGAGIYYLELAGSDDANQVGDFDIASNITINGGYISGTVIDGSHLTGTNQERLFHIINSSGRLTLNDLTLRYGSSLEHGGAIYNENGYVELNSVSLLHNSALRYGGAYATTPDTEPPSPPRSPDQPEAAGPVLVCSECYFQYNTAGQVGGAIFGFEGMVTLDEAYFEENTAQSGGAMLMDHGQTTTIEDSSFINNSATLGHGGALFITGNYNPATIQRSDFQGNIANTFGGAIYNSSGTINITDSAFRHNEANDDGGAILIPNDTSLTLDRVEIDRNSSVSGHGGGISLLGNLNATNVTISRNLSHDAGAGLYTNGAGMSTVSLAFSTIAFNIDENLDNAGDGIWAESGDVSLEATILVYNGALIPDGNNCGGAGYFDSDGYNIETGKTCNLDYSSTDLIYADPRLGSLGYHGSLNVTQVYNLLFDSPAIDFYEGSSCPALDQRNFTRPRDGGSGSAECDSGAFETDRPMLFLPLVIRP